MNRYVHGFIHTLRKFTLRCVRPMKFIAIRRKNESSTSAVVANDILALTVSRKQNEVPGTWQTVIPPRRKSSVLAVYEAGGLQTKESRSLTRGSTPAVVARDVAKNHRLGYNHVIGPTVSIKRVHRPENMFLTDGAVSPTLNVQISDLSARMTGDRAVIVVYKPKNNKESQIRYQKGRQESNPR